MVENTSLTPATGANQTLSGGGGTATDTLSGGGGNDSISAGGGNDLISGDAPLAGQWQYGLYTRDFTAVPDQTQFITSGTLVGRGYVDDFNVLALRNTLAGTAQGTNQDDFGIVYTSTLNISSTGTYTFGTTSDDGSRIIIRDSGGNIVFNLNNDFHQSATTRTGTVALTAGQTYSIEVYYWENGGDTTLSGTIAGPGITGTINLATAPQIGVPPTVPGQVDGNDTLDAGAGDDTAFGGGGQDSILGGTGNDSLRGDAGNDTIDGGDNADSIDGGTGNDSLRGGTGSDTVLGGDNDDTIDGGDGGDRLEGGTGNDNVSGGLGNDQIFGNDGADTLDGGDGADGLDGGIGDDSLFGGTGNFADTLLGGAGNDTLAGGDGNDSLDGGVDNDVLDGGNGLDTLRGGTGNDSLAGAAGTDQLFGDDGNDTLDGGTESDTLDGGTGDDSLSGGTGAFADTLTGQAGNDTLSGGDGNDALDGGADNDRLDGGTGADSMSGGSGLDTFVGGAGADTMDGGTGQDFVDYSASGAGVSVNLATGATANGDAAGDVLSGTDGIIGSAFNDTLTGFDGQQVGGPDAYTNIFFGGAGNDILDGAGGGDQLSGDSGNDTILGGTGDDTMDGGLDNDRLDGGAGNDILTTGAGADFITGSTFGDTPTAIDTVTDFAPGLDTADLSGFFPTLQALRAATVVDINGNAIVTLPNGAQIIFTGVGNATQLTTGNTLVPCYVAGATIATPYGPRAVESLRAGDLVLTEDEGPLPVRWVGRRRLAAGELAARPNLAPVRIAKGALGNGLPEADLWVSPQHRILLSGYRARLVSGLDAGFTPAVALEGLPGVARQHEAAVTYVHLLFDRHQVIRANGVPSESLLPSARALGAFAAEAREEVFAIFPELRAAPAEGPFALARPALRRAEARCILAA